MVKHFTIAETTREERQRLIDEALAIAVLDAPEPSQETKELLEKYVDGKMDLPEILQKTIERYKEN